MNEAWRDLKVGDNVKVVAGTPGDSERILRGEQGTITGFSKTHGYVLVAIWSHNSREHALHPEALVKL